MRLSALLFSCLMMSACTTGVYVQPGALASGDPAIITSYPSERTSDMLSHAVTNMYTMTADVLSINDTHASNADGLEGVGLGSYNSSFDKGFKLSLMPGPQKLAVAPTGAYARDTENVYINAEAGHHYYLGILSSATVGQFKWTAVVVDETRGEVIHPVRPKQRQSLQQSLQPKLQVPLFQDKSSNNDLGEMGPIKLFKN